MKNIGSFTTGTRLYEVADIDNKVDPISSSIDELKSELDYSDTIDYEIIDNAYVYIDNGKQITNEATFCTDFIRLDGRGLKVKTRIRSSAAHAFYDINKNFIKSIQNIADNDKLVALDIPVGAYWFRASGYKEDDGLANFKLIANKKYSTIAKLENEMMTTFDITNKICFERDDQYVKSTGDISYMSGANLQMSEIIRLHYGQTLIFTGCQHQNGCMVSIWNEDGTFKSYYGLGDGTSTQKTVSYTASEEVELIRLGCRCNASGGYKILLMPKLQTSMSENFVDDNNFATYLSNDAAAQDNIFNMIVKNDLSNVMCIGDSLTHGQYYTEDGSISTVKDTYPKFFSDMTGLSTTTFAENGQTISGWWSRHEAALDNANDYQVFFVWLGCNGGMEYPTPNEKTMLTTLDYSTYTDTSFGCYCKILSKIISTNPNAKIVLGTTYSSGAYTPTTNQTIYWLAKRPIYRANIVDVLNLNIPSVMNNKTSIIHPYEVKHYGRIGNMYIAKLWLDALKRGCLNNLSLFEYPTPIN